MSISRQQLHSLIDIVNPKEFSILYYLLTKFIPEDIALPDEVEAMRMGREELARGEFIRHEDIDWN